MLEKTTVTAGNGNWQTNKINKEPHILSVSGEIVNILEGASMDCSE
jgi:hypothetical protein